MAFGKKKKQKKGQAPQQPVQQPSGVKITGANNPFYPPRKESVMKEVLSTLGTVVVCLILVSVIVKNFNYYAIASRQDYTADNDYVTDEVVVYEDVQDSEEEVYIEVKPQDTVEDAVDETYVSDHPGLDPSGTVIEEATPTPENNGDYIIPDSSDRYISEADLQNLTQDELRIARNEIYARHGRMFKDEGLQAYFNSKAWYTGTIAPDNFTQEMLTDIERANTKTISDYESKMGY